MRQTRSFNLNDSNEAHKAIIERLDSEPSVSSVVVQALYHWYFDPQEAQTIMQDNSDVLSAIAELSRKVDRLTQRQATIDVARNESTTELTEDDVSLAPVFLTALKKAARPGMRLEQS